MSVNKDLLKTYYVPCTRAIAVEDTVPALMELGVFGEKGDIN